MFPDEDACVAYLAACRWPDGFRCPRCGEHEAFDLPRRRLWQCKACGHQTSVTAGTVMHRTRTPLLTWFWAAFWMTAPKPGLSALQLQHLLGLARYDTAWLILHTLRPAMSDANRTPLKDGRDRRDVHRWRAARAARRAAVAGRKALLVAVVVEVRRDPGVCGRVIPTRPRRRCRGSSCATSSPAHPCSRTATAATRPRASPRRLHASAADPGSFRLAGTEMSAPRAPRDLNLKAWLPGTHRGVGADQLPVYLDEFVFRWNRGAPMAGFQTCSARHPP